jgi:TPR repeat protein
VRKKSLLLWALPRTRWRVRSASGTATLVGDRNLSNEVAPAAEPSTKGRQLRQQNVAGADSASAATLYTKACDGGAMEGCLNLGVAFATGRGLPKNERRASELYERACEGGQPAACSNLGYFFEHGIAVSKDHSRAFSLYEKSCLGKNLIGCINLAGLYESGQAVKQDLAQAVSLYRQACEGGSLDGCVQLGRMEENGMGVEADQPHAASLYARACDPGVLHGCAKLGTFLERAAVSLRTLLVQSRWLLRRAMEETCSAASTWRPTVSSARVQNRIVLVHSSCTHVRATEAFFQPAPTQGT